MRRRKTAAVLCSAGFMLAAAYTFYLLRTDKNSDYISGSMCLTLALFGVALENIIVYVMKKQRNERDTFRRSKL